MKIKITDGADEISEALARPVTEEPHRTSYNPEAAPESTKSTKNPKKAKTRKKLTKFRRVSIAVLTVGIVALAAGVAFFVYHLLQAGQAGDAEYLVKIGTWQREDAPSVVWDFTEIGKGTLTVNDHINDYDFAWALEDKQLKIDTDWLYTLNNEYNYSLNQAESKLTISTDDDTWVFVPADND